MEKNNTFKMPKDGVLGLAENWKSEIVSAFFVFMISLPFCLSVALAAQLPATSGIVTAIVGGLLVTFFTGSHLTIKTPTIGLVPLMIVAVATLGSGYLSKGYEFTFALIVIAGVVQMLLGVLRLGDWLSIVPDAVIFGLLATMGIKVFAFQVYYLIGTTPESSQAMWALLEFPSHLIYNINTDISIIGGISLLILFLFSSFKYRYATILPAPMLVILAGIFMSYYLDIARTEGRDYLVQMPVSLQKMVLLPNFSKINTWESIELIATIALFSSLEMLLNTKGIDALDFYRRKSKINQELIALGAGNAICGFLGGMPMVASITQSSTNVNSRAKTRWSNFFHAVFLLLFLMIGLYLFQYIPLASIAAILIYTCYTLVSPKLFKDLRSIGKEQLIIFVATLFATLAGGILIGICIGLLVSTGVYIYFGASFKELFVATIKTVSYGNNRTKVMVRSAAVATNYLSLKKQISKLPKGNQIYLDFAKSKVVDHTFMELVYHHPYNYNTEAGSIELQGLENHRAISEHPLATRRMIKKKKGRLGMLEMATHFNERQLDVLAVASVNNAKLRHNLTYDGNKLQGFRFALGYDIKYRENKFSKNIQLDSIENPIKLEFSDIFLSKGLRMSEQNRNMSVLLIHNIEDYIPSFTLNKEGIFAKMLQTVGYEDIDFDDFPVFSEYYYLKGENEQEIRTFFTPELLHFLEKHKDFNIESSDNKIMIHRDMGLMTRNEMEDCIHFAEALIKIIHHEKIENIEMVA